eukprot:1153767-Pleurochrysis_carterae.AAC.1
MLCFRPRRSSGLSRQHSHTSNELQQAALWPVRMPEIWRTEPAALHAAYLLQSLIVGPNAKSYQQLS